MNEDLLQEVVARVLREYQPQTSATVPLEISARHVHLTQEAVERLFGAGYTLRPKKALSQPGEFLAEERVRLAGPGGEIANVAVLGPVRGAVQVEVSRTDAKKLGVSPPLRLSGDLQGAADVLLLAETGYLAAPGSVILAKNHLHMTPADAAAMGLIRGGSARVRVAEQRPLLFEDVAVRVSENYRLAFHVDTDEANACLACRDTLCEVLGQGSPCAVTAHMTTASGRKTPEQMQVSAVPKVVTAAVASGLCRENRTVLLEAKTVVTPSAWDVFRENGIEVTRSKVGGAQGEKR